MGKLETLKTTNLFHGFPAELPDELTEILVSDDGLRIERIVSRGQRSARDFWYDQDDAEWLVLLSGRARLQFESSGRILHLGPGDCLLIPAHVRHRVDWTDPEENTVWLAVFYRSRANLQESPL